MNEAVSTLYFDLGKVLFDFDFDNLFAHVPDSLARDPELIALTGELARQLECGKLTEDLFFQRLVEHFGEFESREHARRAWCEVFRPIDETIDIVHGLARGGRFQLGVISNTNGPHVEELRRLSDVLDCFDYLTLSHEVGCMKPDPGIFQHALQALNAKAENSLFFDDREENVRAAEALGFQAVHVTEPGLVYDALSLRHLI